MPYRVLVDGMPIRAFSRECCDPANRLESANAFSITSISDQSTYGVTSFSPFDTRQLLIEDPLIRSDDRCVPAILRDCLNQVIKVIPSVVSEDRSDRAYSPNGVLGRPARSRYRSRIQASCKTREPSSDTLDLSSRGPRV